MNGGTDGMRMIERNSSVA